MESWSLQDLPGRYCNHAANCSLAALASTFSSPETWQYPSHPTMIEPASTISTAARACFCSRVSSPIVVTIGNFAVPARLAGLDFARRASGSLTVANFSDPLPVARRVIVLTFGASFAGAALAAGFAVLRAVGLSAARFPGAASASLRPGVFAAVLRGAALAGWATNSAGSTVNHDELVTVRLVPSARVTMNTPRFTGSIAVTATNFDHAPLPDPPRRTRSPTLSFAALTCALRFVAVDMISPLGWAPCAPGKIDITRVEYSAQCQG